MFTEEQGRAIVRYRSNGWCEACYRVTGTDWHHRRNRSQGGEWRPSNGLLLCRKHHAWITDNPLLAAERGWTIPDDSDPETVPVVYLTEYGEIDVLLLDSGGLVYRGQMRPDVNGKPWLQTET